MGLMGFVAVGYGGCSCLVELGETGIGNGRVTLDREFRGFGGWGIFNRLDRLGERGSSFDSSLLDIGV